MAHGDPYGLTAAHYVVIIAGLLLFLAPVVYVGLVDDEPVRSFEAHEVEVTNGEQIRFVNETELVPYYSVSDDLACEGTWVIDRPCQFERHVHDLEDQSLLIGNTSSTELARHWQRSSPYRYVQLHDGVYEPTSELVERPEGEENGIYLTLEPVLADEALDSLARNLHPDGVDKGVYQAALEGNATARGGDVGRGLYALDDGSYQRVIQTAEEGPSPWRSFGLRHAFVQALGVVLITLTMLHANQREPGLHRRNRPRR